MKAFRVILFVFITFQLTYCKNTDPVIEDEELYSTMIEIDSVKIEKGDYQTGENVSISMNLFNNSNEPMYVKEVNVKLRDLSVNTLPVIDDKNIATEIKFNPHSTQIIDSKDIYTVPTTITGTKSIGVIVEIVFDGGVKRTIDATFFRVTDNNSLVSYDVKRAKYNGLDVFTLTGGMSAEFGVQNTLASLAGGMSPGWHEAPNTGGPYPVLSTPDFLQRSIKKTIDLYEDVIGATSKVKTVIIGTGVPSVSYLSMSMSAVYLPIHFLASSNTVSEIRSMLNYSNDAGYKAYATFGYDGSIPDVGVAWIKLLDLPEEYKAFIKNHDVEEVIIYGVGEKAGGETYARKLIIDNSSVAYNPGSVYILYTKAGTADDIAALNNRIYDISNLKLAEGANIADWESGITNSQITNFSSSIKAQTNAKPYSITSNDMINLYNISTYLSLKLIQNNQSQLRWPYVKGVIFNEYLVSHPQYEVYWGYIPLLYWQFVPALSTVDRCFGYLKTALASYYPTISTNLSNQKFYLNANYGRNEIKNALIGKGVNSSNITIRNQVDGDRWNPDNGMNSPSEIFAENIVNVGVNEYVTKVKSLVPLSITEIQNICLQTGNIDFKAY